MTSSDSLGLTQGQVVALPFFDNKKFVVGAKRAGGMGAVYQLLSMSPLAPTFALKTYQGRDDLALFEQEARVWISLSGHPNVAKALSYGRLKNANCVLGLWYPGSMQDINPLKMSFPELESFIKGILSGLYDAARDRGLIHKDIKPQNILVDETGIPKIADFGISTVERLVGSIPTPDYRRSTNARAADSRQTVCGTPFFMAPELFQGAANSMSTDIFALGVTLYTWLTGEHPYFDVRGSLRPFDPLALERMLTSSLGANSRPIAFFVIKALEMDPNSRPSSYDVLMDASGFRLSDMSKPSLRSGSTLSEVPHLIATAQVLRRQGQGLQAIDILQAGLERHPDNVLLLSALAAAFAAQGNKRNAKAYFLKTSELNRKARYQYAGRLLVEPEVNLSLMLIDERNFEGAARVLRDSIRGVAGERIGLLTGYWEYAWLDLFDGIVDGALDRLGSYLKTGSAIEPVAALICLASYLTPDRENTFRKLFDLAVGGAANRQMELAYFQALSPLLDGQRRWRLSNMIHDRNAKSDGKSTGQERDSEGQEIREMRALLTAIDDKYFGGKYAEAI